MTLTIVKARNIPIRKKSTVRVRLQMANKCNGFRVETCELNSSADTEVFWDDYTWRFQAEKTTEALHLELLQRSPNTIKQKIYGSKVLGRMSLSWQTLMHSTTLFHDGWFDLSPKNVSAKKSSSKATAPPSLFISMSWTTPQPGPHLFRTIKSGYTDHNLSMVLDNSSAESECWLTRTVLDHMNREVFIVRAR